MRGFAEPKLRGMLDRFSDVLFRRGLEETTGPVRGRRGWGIVGLRC
ncbi:hypothetical protein [Streptomyces chrestomyceticus]